MSLTSPSRVRSTALPLVNGLSKAALVGCLFLVLIGRDWSQLQGKAVGWRLCFYPLSAAAIPIVWSLRGRVAPYPHVADALIVTPFTIDLSGNLLNLYDSITWWDDVNHLVNWALLAAAIACLLRRTGLSTAADYGLAVGFGATAAILWELGEYLAFVQHSTERFTAYRDTMGDEALGLLGSALGAFLAVWPVKRATLGGRTEAALTDSPPEPQPIQ
jgi:hypothetical protein